MMLIESQQGAKCLSLRFASCILVVLLTVSITTTTSPLLLTAQADTVDAFHLFVNLSTGSTNWNNRTQSTLIPSRMESATH